MKIFTKQFKILSITYFLIGIGFVLFSPVYSDEGYYMWVARNVWLSRLLYVDFVYHQFPLLPYLYAPFSNMGLNSYYILKFVSVFSTYGLTLLIYKHVLKTTSDFNSAYFSVVLLIFNGMFVDWNSVVKMYALSNFFCYLSFYMITMVKYDSTFKDKLIFLFIGLISALPSNMRVMFWGCTGVLMIYLGFEVYRKLRSIRHLFYYLTFFLIGLIIPTSLTIYYIVNYTDYFLFGVFRHNFYAQQFVRAEESNLLRWLKFFLMPQNLLLIVFMIIGIFQKFRYKIPAILFLVALLISHAAGYFINEYLTALIPYIIYIAAVNFENIKKKLFYKNHSFMNYAVTFYLLGFFIAVPYFRYKLEGRILEPNLLSLKEMIDYENSLKGQKIYSSWYIYSLFSNKTNDAIKNDYTYSCMIGIPTPEETKKYSLPDSGKITELIKKRYFDVIVLNENTPYALLEHKDMVKEYYKLDRVYGNTEFFIK